MEVHHHPHVEKKKFKEYFLEFLMIFLAVTMGFFAEQLREHFADVAREREYMQEVSENLKYDMIRCRVNHEVNVATMHGLDSLYDISYDYQSIRTHSPELSLLTRDPLELNKYYTQVIILEIQVKRYNFWLAFTGAAAEKLSKTIQNEYHLKNE